jgi:hypothetical protein
MANGDIVDVRYECASVDGCSEKRIQRAKDVKKRDLQRIDELEVPACQPQLVTKPSPSLPGDNSGSVNGSLTVTTLAGNPSAPKTGTTGPRSISSGMNCVCRARPVFPVLGPGHNPASTADWKRFANLTMCTVSLLLPLSTAFHLPRPSSAREKASNRRWVGRS